MVRRRHPCSWANLNTYIVKGGGIGGGFVLQEEAGHGGVVDIRRVVCLGHGPGNGHGIDEEQARQN